MTASSTATWRAPVLVDPRDQGLAWRQRLHWPVGIDESDRIVEGQTARARQWIGGQDDALLRDSALLALPTILGYARAIVLTALAAHRVENEGGALDCDAPEVLYLQTGEEPVPRRRDAILPAPEIRFETARRLARVSSWTPLHRLPRAALCPQATAITHNPLLRAAVRASGRAIGFHHAHLLLDKARRRFDDQPADPISETRSLAESLLPEELPDGRYRERACALLEALASDHLSAATADIASLRRFRLPSELWSGSGGIYAARALGIELLRRGGRMVRFDHGTPKGFVRNRATNCVVEFDVSSDFVLCTTDAARICQEFGAGPPLPGAAEVQWTGGGGDPIYALAARRGTKKSRSSRPLVVYAPTLLTGFRQLAPPMLPDPIYLDWQLRVAESLAALPIDLVCQPHPEGLYAAFPHPLERVADTRRGDFAAQLGAADVFVFDYPSTTALWEAICAEARVVYLDLGMGGCVTSAIKDAFEARCIVLPVSFDHANRPVLDGEVLAEAVMDRFDQADPSYFRRILAGDH